MSKICFVSSLFSSSYNTADKPIKFKKSDIYDYYLFTNLNKKKFSTSWKIININDKEEPYLKDLKKYITKSRYFKFMTWKYFKEIKKNYDVIFYCDATYIPKTSEDWTIISNDIVNSESGIIQSLHKLNVYDELRLIKKCKKDSNDNVKKTINFLKEHNVPIDLKMPENTVFGYDPNNKNITDTFEHFWTLYSQENLTHRDQPILGYIYYLYKINPNYYSSKMSRTLFKLNNKSSGFNNHRYV